MSATESSRLLHTTQSQLDTTESAQESSWCDTAARVGKFIGLLVLTVGLFFIPLFWTYQPMVELWNGKSEEPGIPAAAYATEPRQPELHLYGSLEKGEAGLEGFVEVDSGTLPESLAMSEEQLRIARAVKNIQSGSYTEKGTVYTYIDFLEERYGEQAIFIKELIDPMRKENIFESKIIPEVARAVKEGKQFVFIPVVQTSRRDHIVLFTLNLKNGSIEYFNPKGTAPDSEKLCALPEMSLSQFRSELTRVLMAPINWQLGAQENPDLVELRDLLAQTDNDSLQTILKDPDSKFLEAYSKLTGKVVSGCDLEYMGYPKEFHDQPPTIGFVIRSLFAIKGSSIPELRKLVEACGKEDIKAVREALVGVKGSSFPRHIRDQIDKQYSASFSAESLLRDAQQELDRMESIQSRLLSAVDAEILKRGAKSNPYRAGTYNESYGSQLPHQGKTDWKNCGRFVMHFMKMRLEQNAKPKDEQAFLLGQRSRDFQAATAAVKKTEEIRRELTADLTSG